MNMVRLKLTFLAAAAAMAAGVAIAATSPAFSHGLVVQGAAAPSARVAYADLDLSSPAGVARLEGRIHAAADRLCIGDGVETLHAKLDAFACRDQAIAAADLQVRRAIDRFAAGERSGTIALAN
jgi:UrcA family protein